MESSEIAECALRLVLDGQVDAARQQVGQLRANVQINGSPALTSRVMIVEGCAAAYVSDWPQARDRLTRALLLARTTRSAPIESLSLAWLSYVDFAENHLEEAARRAVAVLGNPGCGPFASYRAASVLASLLEISGLRSHSKKYFDLARRSASKLSQPSATSAVLFDIVTTRVSSERFDFEVLGKDVTEDQLTLVSANSSRNFDLYGGIRVLDSLHGLVKGQVLNLLRQFDAAQSELCQALQNTSGLSEASVTQLKFELLWAELNLESIDRRPELLAGLTRVASDLVDHDDIAIAFSRIAREYRTLKLFDLATNANAKAASSAEAVLRWRDEFSQFIIGLIATQSMAN